MKECDILQRYHMLYELIRQKPRYDLDYVAEKLGMSGRGKTKSAASNSVNKLYSLRISLRPNLILRSHENVYPRAYFLRAKEPSDISVILQTLRSDPRISYMLLLSGAFDFFVTSRFDLSFEKNVRVVKKSTLYTPIYTIPIGWRDDIGLSFRKIANDTLLPGKIERTLYDYLPWEDVHFQVFDTMKNDVQMRYSEIARKLKLSPNTVKKYFVDIIMPHCNIAHYFFPKGYDHYQKSLILLETESENDLVHSLYNLPCTSYVFPLENEIAVIIFHEAIGDPLFAFKKLEEKGCISRHLLLVPLHWE